MARLAFMTNPTDAERTAEKVALYWVLERSRALQREGLILIPTFQQLDIFEQIVGGDLGRAIKKSRSGRSADGGTFKVTTWQQIPYSHNGPVAVFWPSTEALDKVDSISSVPEVIVVPWGNPEKIQNWISTWSVVNIQDGSQTPADEDTDPVVEAALKTLTQTVNVGTGISNTDDRHAAIHILRALKSAGYALDPLQIKRELLRLHWQPKHAEEVRDVTQRINEGRRFAKERPFYRSDIIEYIKSQMPEE